MGEAPLHGKVALVAGATRGAGRAFAVELGRAGATVYVTGRTTRQRRSEVGRAETIEETAELVAAAGGEAVAVPTDHLEPAQVRALTERIDRDHGRLDVLVNDVWGGDHLLVGNFDTKLWDLELDGGLRMLRLGIDTHAITSYFALPLLIRNPGGLVVEVTDGTEEFNRQYRGNFFFDLAKTAPLRMTYGLSEELRPHDATAVCVTPGWLRSEEMLDHFGVTEETWRDAIAKEPHFAIAETPYYLARGVAALAADPRRARWSGTSVSSGELAKAYGVTDLDGSAPDCMAYFRDVVLGGAPGDAADYR
ncbi:MULTISPECIES: SDR family oxidoreductase [Streptomycetaceae]|uniref:Short chain dehydrogenase n=1 Tax=Streptantibioticus cattleyicolor (strain ATCC 35852 / DSM 46488 / JCM 4925 / NBRC 14057 / NRRL 8057) TaxID=1003195 RepID=F8K1Y4_STREN|nr:MULTISPECIES: SDR family oxidoreductase [Streptomycetaceae]AEW93676.1 short chain dehydrogenase [Streptantibioticus cattleyicolor NRRL 8057 = DSM 46488]MYS58377.1 SDR family NAD(P)-dependent oxidoreductase [Streptomyces sp. SID5468]CCB74026.1 putative oxidoreductase [Streptantibioticus cattleyicolor NRRL 8057 = DSM 46488]